MKWLFLTVIPAVVFIDGCSHQCDCGPDGGSDASLVSTGQACSTEGASAPGLAPVCSDIGGGATTCTCTSGAWDCGKCPACGPITLGAPCGIGQVCSGPVTVTQCNGTTSATDGGCHCGGGWECDGVTEISCGDAGSDASKDALGD